MTERDGLSGADARLIQESFERMATAFNARTAAADSSLAEIKAKLASIDTLLRGDGAEGLVTRVSNIQVQLAATAEEVKTIRGTTGKFYWWLLGILVSMVGGLISVFVLAKLTK